MITYKKQLQEEYDILLSKILALASKLNRLQAYDAFERDTEEQWCIDCKFSTRKFLNLFCEKYEQPIMETFIMNYCPLYEREV